MRRTLIVDLETDSLDTSIANIAIFSAYDIEEEKFFVIKHDISKIKHIQGLLDVYDFIITFNGEKFDLPIMARHQLFIPSWKHIDLYVVMKKRQLLVLKEGFKSLSLKNIINVLKLDNIGKGDIDYKIFQRNDWNIEEQEIIINYCKQDLLLTSKLWSFLQERFEGLKHYISINDVMRYKHVTLSSGAYAYKSICYLAGLEEVYDDVEVEDNAFEGGYVSTPTQESAKGNILLFDFSSLYPTIMVQANLFSDDCNCCSEDEKWNGSPSLKVEGMYCNKIQGSVESIIKKLSIQRKEYKIIGDNRESAIKIISNSIYGISANPKFQNVYNKTAASDCTLIGRQCIKFASKMFIDSGFMVLYNDTDSCYVLVPNDKSSADAVKVSVMINDSLRGLFPFPWDEFGLKLDDEIVYLQFFTQGISFLKKHYLYINKDGLLIIKGLKVVKKDCSALSTKIFGDVLKPLIIRDQCAKFDRSFIDEQIKLFLEYDLLLAAKRFNIRDEDYKSRSCIQSIIKDRFGGGEHKLIKNFKLGVGKGVKYCTVSEAKSLEFDDIDTTIFVRELSPFIKDYGVDELDRKTNRLIDAASRKNKSDFMQSDLFDSRYMTEDSLDYELEAGKRGE